MNTDRDWLSLELAKMKEREIYLISNRPIGKVLRFHVEQLQSTEEKLDFLTEVFCLTEEIRHELVSESCSIKEKAPRKKNSNVRSVVSTKKTPLSDRNEGSKSNSKSDKGDS